MPSGRGSSEKPKGSEFSLIDDARIIQVLSWHQVHTDEDAADALWQVKAAGLMPENQVRLWVMADGVRWIWKQAQPLFSSAVEIVDDDHCWEHLRHVSALPYGDHPERQYQ